MSPPLLPLERSGYYFFGGYSNGEAVAAGGKATRPRDLRLVGRVGVLDSQQDSRGVLPKVADGCGWLQGSDAHGTLFSHRDLQVSSFCFCCAFRQKSATCLEKSPVYWVKEPCAAPWQMDTIQ